MADTEQHQVAMLEASDGTHQQCITENGEIITVAPSNDVDNGDVGEDILEQALEEACQDYDHPDVEYTSEENITVVADGNGTLSDANGVTYRYVTTTAEESPTIATVQPGQSLIRIAPNAQASASSQIVAMPRSDAIVTTQTNQPQVVQVVRPQQPQQVVSQVLQRSTGTQGNVLQATSQGLQHVQQTHVQLSQSDSGTPGAITVLTNNNANGEPLGSSGNPIRIIQQGNKYTSVQQLTPEQVAQIMQVVQQQQLAQSTTQGGGSSVLFNPQTQTRIVYRVIYPSELHSKNTGTQATVTVTGKAAQPKTITVPKHMLTLASTRRPYRKRLKDDDEKVDGPDLTKEEKEHRKKHRPRTRSGRVSRPPKHMVQDYKHIHHLDWEEDYDDSDGGYSDYKVTDDEGDGDGKETHRDSSYMENSLGSSKPKKFKCDKCEKAYIGAAGLARHYRLNPEHGDAEELLSSVEIKPKPVSATTNGVDAILSLADDSSTQDSISSTASVPTTSAAASIETSPSITVHPAVSSPQTIAKSPVPKGALKAKQYYIQENTPTRRKARLKELVRQCSDEELMEVVLPRLSRVITLWEFLLMKVERGRPSRPHIADVLSEYEGLNRQVQKMCGDYLQPLSDTADSPEKHTNVLQMTNAAIAESLGLSLEKYTIRDVPKRDESSFQYKLLTTDPSAVATQEVKAVGAKRTVQLVTPDQLVADSVNPAKRPRLNEPCIAAVSQESGIVTVSITNGREGEGDGQTDTARERAGDRVPSEDTEDMTNTGQTEGEERPSSDHLLASGQILDAEMVDSQIHDTLPSTSSSQVASGTPAVSDKTSPLWRNKVGQKEVSAVEQQELAKGESMMDDTQVTPLLTVAGGTTVISEVDLPSNQPKAIDSAADGDGQLPSEQAPSRSEGSPDGQMQQVVVVGESPAPEQIKVEEGEQQQVLSINAADAGETSEQRQEETDQEPQQEEEQQQQHHQEQQVLIAQQQQQVTQELLRQEGHTVLFSSDGGQTFYQQGPNLDQVEASEQQEQQTESQAAATTQEEISLETQGQPHQQLVSMQTPEGLVEGQLVTNEDGTQFIIPTAESSEQTLFQTADGMLVVQNPDGSLRIFSSGDSQIPLETVLLAFNGGESQVQVEAGTSASAPTEQAT